MSHARWISAFLAVATALPLAAASGAEGAAAVRIDAVASAYAALGRFSGSVLVAKDGAVILSRGYGEASREHNVAVTPRTKFRIASLSKQFTAAAILKLESEGKLKVGDPIVRHLPDYPLPQGEKVTIHHLLSMSSGIPSLYRRGDGLDEIDATGEPVSLDELIAFSSGRELLFEPGGKYRYSNTGYMILARIIEKVSGLTYAEYMKAAIFEPAGLRDTSVIDDTVVLEHRAEGYTGFPGGVTRPPYGHPSWALGAASVVTTVEDLYTWDRVLRSDVVLPSAQRDKFAAHHVDWGDEGGFYAYGWWGFERNGRRVINHGGTGDGFVCELYRFPDHDAVVIVLSNLLPKLGVNIPDAIATRAADILFGDEATPAPPLPATSSPVAPTGVWTLDERRILEVSAREGNVVASTRGEATWSLFSAVRQAKVDGDSPVVRRASEIIGHLRAREFDKVAASTMEEWPATAETFEEPWSKWIATHGEVEALAPISHTSGERVDVVTFLVVCQARRGTVDIVMRKDGLRLAGWWENFAEFPQNPVELRPASDGSWFADGFRIGMPDAILRFDAKARRISIEERDWK
jgi:CubicO group peptidase (beta-lactamase class C family)